MNDNRVKSKPKNKKNVKKGYKTPYVVNAADRARKRLQLEARSKIHQKISENEQDNSAVEAMHKAEIYGEEVLSDAKFILPDRDRLINDAIKLKQRSERRREEQKRFLAFNNEYEKANNKSLIPGKEKVSSKQSKDKKLNKSFISKKSEAKGSKEIIKKHQFRANRNIAYKEAAKNGGKVVAKEGSKVVSAAVVEGSKKTGEGIVGVLNLIGMSTGTEEIVLLVIAGIFIILAIILGFMLLLASFMFFKDNITSVMYQSEPMDIEQAEIHLSYLEANLRYYVENIENYESGYDAYVIESDPIGHNPFTLINYLSAKYGIFKYSEVEGEIDDLFNQMYELETFVEEVEIEEDEEEDEEESDEDSLEDEEEVEVETIKTLHVKLTKKSLEDIVFSLMDDEQKEMYNVYLSTHGGRQVLASPIDTDWYGLVSAYYGYRISPMSNTVQFHRGLDIAIPENTNIYACVDGIITEINFDSGGYGIFVVLEGDKDIVVKYAHLNATKDLYVGKEVKRGDLIAFSGNTGASTGPHLHLECMRAGEYYNPVFYVRSND